MDEGKENFLKIVRNELSKARAFWEAISVETIESSALHKYLLEAGFNFTSL